MITGFIYEWSDSATGLKYVGRHEGLPDDGYVGSGTIFIKEYNSRTTDFSRQILWFSDNTTIKELIKQEEQRLSSIPDDQLYYGTNRKYYNQVRNSSGYTSIDNPMKSPETVERMLKTREASGTHKGPWQNTVEKYGYEEACRMNSSKRIGNKNGQGNKGKSKTEQHKENLSKAIKEKIAKEPVLRNSGRKHKMPPDALVKLVKEFGLVETSKQLNETRVNVRSRYYNALKTLQKKQIHI